MRGVDERNIVMNIRDTIRANNNLLANNDFRRNHDLFNKRLRAPNLIAKKPVVSARGGDLKDLVKQGREKAQFNKAVSLFTSHTQPLNAKIGGGYIS